MRIDAYENLQLDSEIHAKLQAAERKAAGRKTLPAGAEGPALAKNVRQCAARDFFVRS